MRIGRHYIKSDHIVVAAVILFLVVSQGQQGFMGAVTTIVPEEYKKTLYVDPTGVSLESCDIQAKYEAGECNYVYACYMILPRYSTLPQDAVQKECKEVKDLNNIPPLYITFTPTRGKQYAVFSFMVSEWKSYDFTAGTWSTSTTILNKQVEGIIGLCPEGKMLKNNLCWDAQGWCIEHQSTNVCQNDFDIYCLSYGTDAAGNPIYDCDINPSHLCADGQTGPPDGVCDQIFTFCDDLDGNGVCDSTDALITYSSCIDANMNGICDDIETGEAIYCPAYFNPVCDTSTATTYPNSCFGEAAGVSYSAGACIPADWQCDVVADCKITIPCDGPVTQCLNHICTVTGQCVLKTCESDADCISPCKGITGTCGENYHCQYVGQCITKPEKATLWEQIFAWFDQFWGWIVTQLGWA